MSKTIELPCNIGDTVYTLAGRFGEKVEEDICDGFYIKNDGVLQVKMQSRKGSHGTYGVMGDTIFKTHEEAAEAAAVIRRKHNE